MSIVSRTWLSMYCRPWSVAVISAASTSSAESARAPDTIVKSVTGPDDWARTGIDGQTRLRRDQGGHVDLAGTQADESCNGSHRGSMRM